MCIIIHLMKKMTEENFMYHKTLILALITIYSLPG